MTVFIYALSDASGIRYVGKSVDLPKRLERHIQDSKVCYKTNWIRGLLAKGIQPELLVLEKIANSDDKDWQDVERFWISYLRFLGCRLTNLDSGGRRGKRLSEETKRKMSLRIRSEEVRKLVGDKLRGRKRPPEVGRKISAAKTGFRFSNESKLRMSLAHRGKKLKPESIAKRTLKQKGIKRTEETKRRMSEARLRWHKMKTA